MSEKLTAKEVIMRSLVARGPYTGHLHALAAVTTDLAMACVSGEAHRKEEASDCFGGHVNDYRPELRPLIGGITVWRFLTGLAPRDEAARWVVWGEAAAYHRARKELASSPELLRHSELDSDSTFVGRCELRLWVHVLALACQCIDWLSWASPETDAYELIEKSAGQSFRYWANPHYENGWLGSYCTCGKCPVAENILHIGSVK